MCACSFEWFIGFNSWRASVTMWQRNSFYRHSKSGDIVLADAGWHCSYCFRTIAEYVIKMKGFSHSDRIGGRMDLLDPNRIQTTICRGKDIFGMLPEAYSVSVRCFSLTEADTQVCLVRRSILTDETGTVRILSYTISKNHN